MRRSYVGELSLHRSWDYEHRLPGDVSPSRASSPRVLALRPEKTALGCAERHLGHIGVGGPFLFVDLVSKEKPGTVDHGYEGGYIYIIYIEGTIGVHANGQCNFLSAAERWERCEVSG